MRKWICFVPLKSVLGRSILHYLPEHKFSPNFQNCINPLCSWSMDIELTSHFFLHCPLIDDRRITLLSTQRTLNEYSLTKTLLFGNSLFDLKNTSLSTGRFDKPLQILVSIATTKHSCISNHSLTLSEFFHKWYLYLYFLSHPRAVRIFGARWL